MKLGIITDIHNNLIALNTILEYFEEQNCDKIICCGDIIGIGPYPEETVQRIMMVNNLIAVKGNHDGYLVDGMPTEFPNEEHMDYGEMLHHKWEHGRLSESSIDFLKSLPVQAKFSIGKYEIVVIHYCMDDTVEIESVELPYDVDVVIKKIDELSYPEAENIKKVFLRIMIKR